jgi:hypothetical protein
LRCRGVGCGRLLTAPESRARGFGRQCWDEYVAAHPELAPRRRKTAVKPAVVAAGPIDGQEALFETLEGSDA